MAYYAALVSLLKLLEDIIHRDRNENLLLDKQQTASVYENFSLLQTLLDDYSPKDREVADSLERQIRDAAYQAQDIIESHISNQMPQYLSQKKQMPNQQLQELEEVKEGVNSIVEELMTIRKNHTAEDKLQLNYYSANSGTSNQVSGTNTMEGFEECLTTIKHQLCGEPSKLRVVSIVGMGGIGKTTLARNIFDDGLIVYRFDCRVWITVSQDYHEENVLLDILHSMKEHIDKPSKVGEFGEKTYSELGEKKYNELKKKYREFCNELGEKVYKHLKGRRYLIIIDDMWDTKVWDNMKRILPDDSNGSRIMITTRISNVASYADRSGFNHHMQLLNEDQSWNLFCEKVFCPPYLEDIGRSIVENCRGLPLAIVVVAGLLSKVNKSRCDWKEIAKNVSSTAAANDEHFSKILSLSYSHLPHHLKPCLLYIGGFPEDYKIHVSKLVKLWIAEGFLKPIESKSLEAVAEEYLEDLVNRNLVLIIEKGSNGKIKSCGIHDLLRDLCTEIIRHEDFFHIQHKGSYFGPIHPTITRNVRRLYLHCYFSYLSPFSEAKKYVSHVRSIISDANDEELFFYASRFKLLRVLHAKQIHVSKFPDKFAELFHLRFLSFMEYQILSMPPSISLLQNLQTLIIASKPGLRFCSLPSQIREMPNLRHIMSSANLHFECDFFHESIVGKPSILENLQTLSWVKDVRFTNEVIKMIPNLQKLKISYYEEKDVEWQKFRLDKLFHLHQLETLNIYFLNPWRQGVNPFPESFAFPLTLKKLSLRHCKIPWRDMKVVGSLPNLQVLKLRDEAFVGEKWETVEGEFLKLKFLLMEELELKYWQAENTHFPTLQHLKISSCWMLQEIPPEIGEISTLELVEVNYSKFAAKSALQMQKEQMDQGNDILQVRVCRHSWQESDSDEELQKEASESEDGIQEEALERADEMRKEPSKSEDEMQDEASKSMHEMQDEASKSEHEMQDKDGLENREEIQDINLANSSRDGVHKTSKWKYFCFQ